MHIQMVDLQGQYQHIKNEIDAAMREVVDSAAFINGPAVRRFQENLERYLGDGVHVIPCANGTDALQIALMALDLSPGDEVIVPAFTYVATAEVIALLRLRPVMVDVDPHTFNVSPEIVEAAVTPRVKAVVPVNLFGQSCDIGPIMDIARRRGLWVVEDNAQAIGADYRPPGAAAAAKTGTLAHIACTSFYPSKNLGAYGDGGAMYTNDEALAQKLRMIANHGQVKRYYHDLVGCNSRLDALQAAILDVKLPHLDQYAAARRAAADYYDEALGGIDALRIPHRASYSSHVFHQYTLIVEDDRRDQLQNFLREKGIPTMIYYPVPLYRQPAFRPLSEVERLPVTEALCQRVISLPIHTELKKETLEYICANIEAFFAG